MPRLFSSAAIERAELRKEIEQMQEAARTARMSSDTQGAKEIEDSIREKQARYDALGKRSRKRTLPEP